MQLDQFPGFKHFLVCYFNISTDFSDLKHLALDYKNRESEKSVNTLVNELNTISAMKDLEAVKTFVKKHGMRRLNQRNAKDSVGRFNLTLLVRSLYPLKFNKGKCEGGWSYGGYKIVNTER